MTIEEMSKKRAEVREPIESLMFDALTAAGYDVKVMPYSHDRYVKVTHDGEEYWLCMPAPAVKQWYDSKTASAFNFEEAFAAEEQKCAEKTARREAREEKEPTEPVDHTPFDNEVYDKLSTLGEASSKKLAEFTYATCDDVNSWTIGASLRRLNVAGRVTKVTEKEGTKWRAV